MITTTEIFYYSLFLLCIFCSFLASTENIPGLNILRILFLVGFASEMIVEVLQYYHLEENGPHFIYIPIEYLLICLWLKKNTNVLFVQKAINISLFVYFPLVITMSVFYYGFGNFPSMIYMVNCLLIILWTVIMLLNFDVSEEISITSRPVFWILVTLTIFYSTIFFFTGGYNFLVEKSSLLGEKLRNDINVSANFFLYIGFIYSFICSIKLKRFIHQ